jgi:hypothetical protein
MQLCGDGNFKTRVLNNGTKDTVTEGRGNLFVGMDRVEEIMGALKRGYKQKGAKAAPCDGVRLAAALDVQEKTLKGKARYFYRGVYGFVCVHDIMLAMGRLPRGEEWARILALCLHALAVCGSTEMVVIDIHCRLSQAFDYALKRCAQYQKVLVEGGEFASEQDEADAHILEELLLGSDLRAAGVEDNAALKGARQTLLEFVKAIDALHVVGHGKAGECDVNYNVRAVAAKQATNARGEPERGGYNAGVNNETAWILGSTAR